MAVSPASNDPCGRSGLIACSDDGGSELEWSACSAFRVAKKLSTTALS
jgi:hypothetical protein